jgi:uncharacterized damage-inducible protein DinB
MSESTLPEPWLRGTLSDVAAVPRAVLHALELANQDVESWCGRLSGDQLNARPLGLPSVAFHLRHIARSIDRLLTYAEGHPLSEQQLRVLNAEQDAGARREEVFAEFIAALEASAARIRAFSTADMEQGRTVGKKQLPTTVGGLLVHVADHTQRHVGQAVTTAKLLIAQRAQQ